MAYKTRYRPKNPEKYTGDLNNIICRSTWERQVAKWADRNKAVTHWSMESVIIRYFDKGSGKNRRYFVDFYFKFKDGKEWIVEVKPKNQTKPPKERQRKTKKYLEEIQRYATNVSKWNQAKKYAKAKGWRFSVWTEDHLKQLGLRIL